MQINHEETSRNLLPMELPQMLNKVITKLNMSLAVFDLEMHFKKLLEPIFIFPGLHFSSQFLIVVVYWLIVLVLNYQVMHDHTWSHDFLQSILVPKSSRSMN